MLLTVDIGNTTVAVAGFSGERPAFLHRLPAGREEGPRDWAAALRTLLAGEGPFRGAALSSVVPALTDPVADALACVTGGRVLTVGRDTPTGLPLGDYDGAALGMDRVVDCVAALARYAPPLAVFDMGTATTLSVVDRERVTGGSWAALALRASREGGTAPMCALCCASRWCGSPCSPTWVCGSCGCGRSRDRLRRRASGASPVFSWMSLWL